MAAQPDVKLFGKWSFEDVEVSLAALLPVASAGRYKCEQAA
jgi:hypothetical protein